MHPSRDDLLGLVLGTLEERQADTIVEHLTNCDECEETLNGLEAHADEFVEHIRQPATDDAILQESGCHRFVDAVKQMGRDASLATRKDAAVTPVTDLGKLGQYKLLAKLGAGGMGAVYKALHTKLDKVVAIKVLPGERMRTQGWIERFKREMKAVGKLDHENIVRAMDAGEIDDTHFLVMEFVDGIDLSKLARRMGPLDTADACEIVRQAAVALDHAHQRGMVHRDVKPSNIMLAAKDDDRPVVKILDMGLALLGGGGDDDRSGLTGSGQMVGTVEYMAPEQGMDSHVVDIRADVYALGATLFRLLAGESPFAGGNYESPLQLMMAKVTQPAPSLGTKRSDLPDGLVTVVDRMLAIKPQKRFASPAEVAQALKQFAAGNDLKALLDAASIDGEADALSPRSNVQTDNQISTVSRETGTAAAVSDSASGVQQPTATISYRDEEEAAVTAPARQWAWGRPLALVAAAVLGIVLLAGTVFYFRTPDGGTLIVEVNDPNITVSVQGENIQITRDKSGKPITIRPGKHKLHVTRDGLEFTTDHFTLKKGEKVVVSVRLVKGEVRVVQGDTVIGKGTVRREIPAVIKPPVQIALSPFHQLRPEDDDPYERKIAGEGDAAKVSKHLVAILGDSRLKVGRQRVGFSPDGKWIVTLGTEIWNAETGQLLRRKKGVSARPQFALSPDGRHVAYAGGRTRGFYLAVDELVSGKELRSLELDGRFSKGFNKLTYSPDGKLLASWAASGEIMIWDAQSLKPLKTLQQKKYGRELAFHPDGTQLASGGEDGFVRIWNPTTWKLIHELDVRGSFEKEVVSLGYSADGNQLVVALGSGPRGKIEILDSRTGKRIRTMKNRTNHFVISPDGKQILTHGWKYPKRIEACDAHTGKPIRTIAQTKQSGTIEHFDVNWKRKRIVTCSQLSHVRVWNLESGKQIFPSKPDLWGSQCVAVSADGSLVAQGGQGVVVLWDVASRMPLRTLTARSFREGFSHLDFSPDGKWLAGVQNGPLGFHLWNVETGKPHGVPENPYGGPWTATSFTPDSKRLAVCSGDRKSVFVFDVARVKITERYRINGQRVAFSPVEFDGAPLLAVASKEKLHLIHPTLKRTIKLKTHLPVLRFSPDGTLLYGSEYKGNTHIWDVRTGNSLGERKMQMIDIALSPANQRRLVGLVGTTVVVDNLTTGERIQVAENVSRRYGNRCLLRFTPDGDHVVVAKNSTILVFRLGDSRTKHTDKSK